MNMCLLIFCFTLSGTDLQGLSSLGKALESSLKGRFTIHAAHAYDMIELFIAAPKDEWETFRNSEAGDRYARFAESQNLLGVQVFDLVETINPSGSFRSTNPPTPKGTYDDGYGSGSEFGF